MAGTASVRTIVTAVLFFVLAAAVLDAACSRIHAQNVDRLFGVIIDQVERAAREKERRRIEKQPSPPVDTQSSLGQIKSSPGNYAVGGILLGSQVSKESLSARFPQMTCSVSSQFAPAEWCSGRETRPEARGQFTLTTSVLLSERTVVAYVNQSFSPAFFTPNEIDEDIDRYSQAVRAAPRRMNTKLPFVNGEASIAIWGNVQLEPISPRAIEQIRAKKSADEGILVDYLGDFYRSLDNGLPVYRVVSGHGYVWSGWRDQRGVGHLRAFAIDIPLLKGIGETASSFAGVSTGMNSSEREPEQAPPLQAGRDAPSKKDEPSQPRSVAEHQAAQKRKYAELERHRETLAQAELQSRRETRDAYVAERDRRRAEEAAIRARLNAEEDARRDKQEAEDKNREARLLAEQEARGARLEAEKRGTEGDAKKGGEEAEQSGRTARVADDNTIKEKSAAGPVAVESKLAPCPADKTENYANCYFIYSTPANRRYVVEFNDASRPGFGVGQSSDGFRSEGMWRHGKPNGLVAYSRGDGYKYSGEVMDEKWNGRGSESYLDGRKYTGEFKDGKYHGLGKYTFPDGKEHAGTYKDGKPSGKGTVVWPNGDKLVGTWSDGGITGTKTWKSGRVHTGEYDFNYNPKQGYTFDAKGSGSFFESTLSCGTSDVKEIYFKLLGQTLTPLLGLIGGPGGPAPPSIAVWMQIFPSLQVQIIQHAQAKTGSSKIDSVAPHLVLTHTRAEKRNDAIKRIECSGDLLGDFGTLGNHSLSVRYVVQITDDGNLYVSIPQR